MRSEPHRIPLSRELTNVLQSLPKIGEYVFPNARSDKGVSNMAMFSAKETLLKKMNRDRSGKSQWIDPKSGPPINAAWISGDFQNAFRATSSRSRWAIRLGIRLSGPIGELQLRPTSSNYGGLGRFLLWQTSWPKTPNGI